MGPRCLLWLFLSAAAPEESTPTPPRAPRVAAASDEGALALESIRVPPGFRVAAEPLLANPVAFCVDEKGRFFVAETFRIKKGVTDTRDHMEWLDDDLACRTVEDRVAMYRKHLGDVSAAFTAEEERVRLIEDVDGDGRADRSQVFAGGFHDIPDGIGAGVLASRGRLWFSCIPHLWLLQDQDGDGKAELRRSLHRGYGVHVGFYGHDLHGLRFGPDGRLYFTIGDRGLNVETEGRTLRCPDTGAVLRCEPDGSGLEVFATGLRNPQELAFNDHGDLFTGDNNADGGDQARFVHLVEGGDSGWRIGYQFLDFPVPRGPWNAEKLWLARRQGQAAYLIPPVGNIADGPSGLCYYPGTGLPPRYQGHFFLCDFRGASQQSGVRSFALKEAGASYELADEHQFAWSVLATDADFGPGGGLYLTDWVEGWEGTGKGRIYRVFDPSAEAAAEEVRKVLSQGMSGRPLAELASLLGHADQRVRQEAQFELAERGAAALSTLEKAAQGAGARLTRLHAVWGLGQIGRRDGRALEPLLRLLEDPDREVRAQAARVLGDARAARAGERLIVLLRDPEPRVRFFSALALGKLGRREAAEPVLQMLEANDDRDPCLRHAAVMALSGIGDRPALLAAARHASAAARMGALLALSRLRSPEVALFLDDSRPELVLEAARAIHDLPLEEVLPRLGALPLRRGVEWALGARVLNAGFRQGRPENARALAQAAASEELAEELRREALLLLGDWPSPSPRDRVLGLFRPLPPRPAEAAREALLPHLGSLLRRGPESVRLEAMAAAVRLGLREWGPAVFDLLSERNLSGELRAEALRALETLAPDRLLEAARLALRDGEPLVRREGRRILAKVRPAEALAVLEEALESGSTLERQGALASLSGMAAAGAADVLSRWLDRLLAGAVPLEIQLDLLEAAARHPGPGLKAKLERYEAGRPRDEPLAAYRECLAGGSAQRGRTVFYQKAEVSCLRCHRAEGAGGEVGPNLAGVGGRETREHLLESLLAPNRKIAKGYETVVLLTREGSLVLGVLKDEDQRQVRLTTAEGKVLAVPRERIRERMGGVSAMPEDVSKHLTRWEVRDLVEYLASLK